MIKNQTNSAVFIDRDGTINEDVGYLDSPDGLRLLSGSAEAIKKLNRHGFKVIVVSNQSGVARGYFPESTVQEIHVRLKDLLAQEGACLDGIYYCPHHPEIGEGDYRQSCNCRKPATGMLETAAREHDINLAASFVIGDKISDVSLAHNAGAKGILVLTGYGRRDYESHKDKWPKAPDYIARDLSEAVEWMFSTIDEKG